jgi:hypothetical protein
VFGTISVVTGNGDGSTLLSWSKSSRDAERRLDQALAELAILRGERGKAQLRQREKDSSSPGRFASRAESEWSQLDVRGTTGAV